LADRFLTKEQLEQTEPKFPLEVAFCSNCSLVQILETVNPGELFCDNYPYYSSFSPALLEHSRKNVLDLIQSRKLNKNSFVVELASNDGYLLKNYVDHEIPVLGIDPAEGPAKVAIENNVSTLCDFFTVDLAKKLRQKGKTADVIHANNVLAHVADTNGFVEGIAALLQSDGVAVIEFPYVKDLIDNVEFDTIYHEHLCYFSVTSVDRLFRKHGLFINEVKRLAIHGGSLRIYAEPQEKVGKSVHLLLDLEKKEGIDNLEYYEGFANKVEKLKVSLLSLLRKIKVDNNVIAAYGAAAKGTTLINYIGIDKDLIAFVVDRNVHKNGKFMPGMKIPIRETGWLEEKMPDYVLMLAWNFADEILAQQEAYCKKGGRFILPVPEPRIV